MKILRKIFIGVFFVSFFCGTSVIYVVSSLPDACTSEKKVVLVSIDDCWEGLSALSQDTVRSVYDVPFFRQLRDWNQKYGAKFTCYVYGETETFTLKNVPMRFRSEFEEAASWLKFGFHSSFGNIGKTRNQTAEEFSINFEKVNDYIDSFAGEKSRSSTLRLDYFFAHEDWIPIIFKNPSVVLLGPDMPLRKAYALSDEQSTELWTVGKYPSRTPENKTKIGGYIRTDARYEKMILPWWTLSNLRHQERIVVFTHEWAMSSKVRSFMDYSFRWFQQNGYKFTFLEN